MAAAAIELAPDFVELERAREKFNFTYLPEDTEALVKEAFACFTAGCYNAFASMCRRAAQATFADLGPQARLDLFDELANIRRLAELDDDSYELVRKVLFDFDEPGRGNLPVARGLRRGRAARGAQGPALPGLCAPRPAAAVHDDAPLLRRGILERHAAARHAGLNCVRCLAPARALRRR